MNSRRRTALTFIEVTTVILVLGILAAVSMPRLSLSLQATQLRSASLAIQTHLQHARSAAISRGRSITMVFNNVSESYSCNEIGFPEQPGSVLAVNVRNLFDTSIDIQATFNSGSTLSFDAEGAPYVGTLPLTSGGVDLIAGGVTYRVTVRPGLGTVTSSMVSP